MSRLRDYASALRTASLIDAGLLALLLFARHGVFSTDAPQWIFAVLTLCQICTGIHLGFVTQQLIWATKQIRRERRKNTQ